MGILTAAFNANPIAKHQTSSSSQLLIAGFIFMYALFVYILLQLSKHWASYAQVIPSDTSDWKKCSFYTSWYRQIYAHIITYIYIFFYLYINIYHTGFYHTEVLSTVSQLARDFWSINSNYSGLELLETIAAQMLSQSQVRLGWGWTIGCQPLEETCSLVAEAYTPEN